MSCPIKKATVASLGPKAFCNATVVWGVGTGVSECLYLDAFPAQRTVGETFVHETEVPETE